jgi:hypothetical protein
LALLASTSSNVKLSITVDCLLITVYLHCHPLDGNVLRLRDMEGRLLPVLLRVVLVGRYVKVPELNLYPKDAVELWSVCIIKTGSRVSKGDYQ